MRRCAGSGCACFVREQAQGFRTRGASTVLKLRPAPGSVGKRAGDLCKVLRGLKTRAEAALIPGAAIGGEAK
jgi:hypothetical protein